MRPRPLRRRLTGLDCLAAVPLALILLLVAGVLAALALRLSWGELLTAFRSPETRFALWLSLWTSAAALAAGVALGLPAAYLLARRSFPGQAVVDTLLDIPMVMPPLVAGLGLLFLFGRRMLGEPLAAMGIELLFSPAGVVLAQAFVAATVMVRMGKAAFTAADPGLGDAARTLGATPWGVFWSVDLPLAARGLLAGAVLAWARALGEFGATLLLAGATRLRTETLPMAVFLNIATGETGVAVACALILLAVASALLLVLRGLGGARGGA